MSPGNLYYHFKNKDAIIIELFTRYAERMAAALTFPDVHPLTQADKANLFERVLTSLWDFRFLHRDMTHLLENAQLSTQYRAFSLQVLAQLRELYRAQIAAGMIEADDSDIDTLAITIWITATNSKLGRVNQSSSRKFTKLAFSRFSTNYDGSHIIFNNTYWRRC